MNCFAFATFCIVLTAILLSNVGSITTLICGDSCHSIALYSPVCGSDGETYGNEGDLECEKLCKPGLILVHKGHCKQQSKLPCESCLCITVYEPVCGSDGKTYGNSCDLNCQAKCNPDLRLVHQGECV